MDVRNRVYAHRRGERIRLAKVCQITPTYLYLICLGLKTPSVALAKRIEAATGGAIRWTEFFEPDAHTPSALRRLADDLDDAVEGRPETQEAAV